MSARPNVPISLSAYLNRRSAWPVQKSFLANSNSYLAVGLFQPEPVLAVAPTRRAATSGALKRKNIMSVRKESLAPIVEVIQRLSTTSARRIDFWQAGPQCASSSPPSGRRELYYRLTDKGGASAGLAGASPVRDFWGPVASTVLRRRVSVQFMVWRQSFPYMVEDKRMRGGLAEKRGHGKM